MSCPQMRRCPCGVGARGRREQPGDPLVRKRQFPEASSSSSSTTSERRCRRSSSVRAVPVVLVRLMLMLSPMLVLLWHKKNKNKTIGILVEAARVIGVGCRGYRGCSLPSTTPGTSAAAAAAWPRMRSTSTTTTASPRSTPDDARRRG